MQGGRPVAVGRSDDSQVEELVPGILAHFSLNWVEPANLRVHRVTLGFNGGLHSMLDLCSAKVMVEKGWISPEDRGEWVSCDLVHAEDI